MDAAKKVCHRSGKTIYPADKQVNFGSLDFLAVHFTCKATGTRLTLKTATAIDGEVYLRGEAGSAGKVMMETNKPPSAVPDVITARVGVVPDANMRTADRMFNVAGKQANRGATGDDQGSNYGQGAVAVETQTNTPDHCMNTQDRKFKIADTADGNNYGLDGTVIKTQTNIERPPTSVNNVNMMEKMHNGTAKYTGATTGAASG